MKMDSEEIVVTETVAGFRQKVKIYLLRFCDLRTINPSVVSWEMCRVRHVEGVNAEGTTATIPSTRISIVISFDSCSVLIGQLFLSMNWYPMLSVATICPNWTKNSTSVFHFVTLLTFLQFCSFNIRNVTCTCYFDTIPVFVSLLARS